MRVTRRSVALVPKLVPKIMSTFGVVLLTSSAIAATVSSNHTTSVSPMIDAGWSCLVDESKGYDLNNKYFRIWYGYLENRAIRNGIRAEHIVCELGKPTVDRKIGTNLNVLGYDVVPGEHLLIYGTDVTPSSEEKNILVAFIKPSGVVRQLLKLTPETQSMVGVHVDFDKNEYAKFKGTYKLGDNDVFNK